MVFTHKKKKNRIHVKFFSFRFLLQEQMSPILLLSLGVLLLSGALSLPPPFPNHTNKCVELGLLAQQEYQFPLTQKEFIPTMKKLCHLIEQRSKEQKLYCPYASSLSSLPYKKPHSSSFSSSSSSFTPLNVTIQETIIQSPIHNTFPEQQQQQQQYHPTSMTFSGGGNRALVAESGQLRALHNLNFISKIGYQSSVSGGAWAASIYQYYQKGATNDSQLLGPATSSLSSLTLETLAQPAPPLANTATTNMLKVGLELLLTGRSSLPHLWVDSVGETYLQPFGANKETFFTLSKTIEKEIKAQNPSLENESFLTPLSSLPPRPFFLANSILIGPSWAASSPSLVSLQMTPLYVGSPFIPNNEEQPFPIKITPNETLPLYVGGGLVDNFAFGGKIGVDLEGEKGKKVLEVTVEKPFSLRQVIGFSSNDGAWAQDDEPAQQEFLNPISYWPVLPPQATIPQASEPFVLGDGGSIDYLGILPLIQRKIPTIISFINTDTPLPNKTTFDFCTATSPPPQEFFLDEGLTPLFGVPIISPEDGYFLHNQVFNESFYNPLMCELQTDKEEGRAAVVYGKYELLENKWWGIEGGGEVEVMWVYLEYAEEFVEQLPADTQEQIRLGDDGMFPDFPQYKLTGENGGDLTFTTYTTSQVNLLAAFTEWVVVQEGQQLFDFLK